MARPVRFYYHLAERKNEEPEYASQNMARGGPDLPDDLIVLVFVGVIAAGGITVLNATAEAGSFPGPFRNTAFTNLNLAAAALVLGVGTVGTVIGYLVWFAGSGPER